jgi:hypothetical protein
MLKMVARRLQVLSGAVKSVEVFKGFTVVTVVVYIEEGDGSNGTG